MVVDGGAQSLRDVQGGWRAGYIYAFEEMTNNVQRGQKTAGGFYLLNWICDTESRSAISS